MQSTTRIIATIALLSSVLASPYQNKPKLRRDAVMSLYPFPRVGRTFNTWQIPMNNYNSEVRTQDKRQLHPHPRIGKSFYPQLQELRAEQIEELLSGRGRIHGYEKRDSEMESPGMWFGPRLGRSFKSEDNDVKLQDNSEQRNEFEQTIPEIIEERKKRQID